MTSNPHSQQQQQHRRAAPKSSSSTSASETNSEDGPGVPASRQASSSSSSSSSTSSSSRRTGDADTAPLNHRTASSGDEDGGAGSNSGRFSKKEQEMLVDIIRSDNELTRSFLHKVRARQFQRKSWMHEIAVRFKQRSGTDRSLDAVRHHFMLRRVEKGQHLNVLLSHAVRCTRKEKCTKCLLLARERVERGIARCGSPACTVCPRELPSVFDPFSAQHVMQQAAGVEGGASSASLASSVSSPSATASPAHPTAASLMNFGPQHAALLQHRSLGGSGDLSHVALSLQAAREGSRLSGLAPSSLSLGGSHATLPVGHGHGPGSLYATQCQPGFAPQEFLREQNLNAEISNPSAVQSSLASFESAQLAALQQQLLMQQRQQQQQQQQHVAPSIPPDFNISAFLASAGLPASLASLARTRNNAGESSEAETASFHLPESGALLLARQRELQRQLQQQQQGHEHQLMLLQQQQLQLQQQLQQAPPLDFSRLARINALTGCSQISPETLAALTRPNLGNAADPSSSINERVRLALLHHFDNRKRDRGDLDSTAFDDPYSKRPRK